jgi:hypothetical protein
MKAIRESRGIGLLCFQTSALERGEGLASRPGFFLPPEKDPVPLVQEAGWAPEPVWTGAENLAPTGIRSPDRSARSQSLYRLRYPAHGLHTVQPVNWGNRICILYSTLTNLCKGLTLVSDSDYIQYAPPNVKSVAVFKCNVSYGIQFGVGLPNDREEIFSLPLYPDRLWVIQWVSGHHFKRTERLAVNSAGPQIFSVGCTCMSERSHKYANVNPHDFMIN